MQELAARIAHLLLRLMGFQKGQQGPFTTWTRPPLFPTTSSPVKFLSSQGNLLTETTTPSAGTGSQQHQHPRNHHRHHNGAAEAKEAAHHAADNIVDAAVAASSAAAAAVMKQYPHEGQQYHLPPPSQLKSPSLPIINALKGMMERRVSLPVVASPQRRHHHTRTTAAAAAVEGVIEEEAAAAPIQMENGKGGSFKVLNVETAAAAAAANGGSSTNDNTQLPPPPPIEEEEEEEETVPVVFLHGVGFGSLPYLHFIQKLMKACPRSPFILLEMPHVALRLCREAESVDAVAIAAVAAVERLRQTTTTGKRISSSSSSSSLSSPNNPLIKTTTSTACFIGHSYGTFCISRIVQLFPEAVHSTALLDPVCMLTCYPQLLFNFIYREISMASITSVAAAVDAVRFICSRDLTISQAFCRLFHWSELMLWYVV